MSPPLVRSHRHGPVGTLIINRPQKRNALSRALLAELAEALGDMHLERSIRAVVLTGAGGAFCAGMDLSEMLDTREQPDAHSAWHRDVRQYQDLLWQMLEFPKPIIAAVNGPAIAGGAGLVLASDVVVAGESGAFGLPEPRRGLAAGIVAPLLAFRIGGGPSGFLLSTARTVDAAEALRLGIFHEVVPDEQVWIRAREVGEECAQGAPESLQMTKRMLNETIGEELRALLAAGAAVSATARTTEAAVEGLEAFREKRPPRWP